MSQQNISWTPSTVEITLGDPKVISDEINEDGTRTVTVGPCLVGTTVILDLETEADTVTISANDGSIKTDHKRHSDKHIRKLVSSKKGRY